MRDIHYLRIRSCKRLLTIWKVERIRSKTHRWRRIHIIDQNSLIPQNKRVDVCFYTNIIFYFEDLIFIECTLLNVQYMLLVPWTLNLFDKKVMKCTLWKEDRKYLIRNKANETCWAQKKDVYCWKKQNLQTKGMILDNKSATKRKRNNKNEKN